MTTITIGTRGSKLALWQTERVATLLGESWHDLRCETRLFVTEGDKKLDKPLPEIGGKGLFTAELEAALLTGEIDLAVHSLKDLPVENPGGVILGAILPRADVRDVLLAAEPGTRLGNLPVGATVGTSSLRRKAQLLAARPDLDVQPIRGNVDTRIGKMKQGKYDAIVLAAAGVTRLGLDDEISQWLPLEVMLPAPGQGAMAVQCRADDQPTLRLLASIDDATTRRCVVAERAFLHGLGAGCSLPVGAHAVMRGDEIQLAGLVGAPNGRLLIEVSGRGSDPWDVGKALADKARRRGAAEILDEIA